MLSRIRPALLLSLLVLGIGISCKTEITDFFESIRDYGYKSTVPLGPQTEKVKDQFLGGYVYNSLPVIISKKTATSYEINFLTTSLYKEDRHVEAHATTLNGSTFLNLNMGDYYCFLRVNLLYNEELQIDLVKGTLKQHVDEKNLKSWLSKNAAKGYYENKERKGPDGEYYQESIYYSFTFNKITEERAYEIQANRLYEEKLNRFENCTSYADYEDLIRKYPEPEFRKLGQRSLFSLCETRADYEEFITYFPDSELVDQAQSRIEVLRKEEEERRKMEQDRKEFELASQENVIEGFERFIANRNTDFFLDSANARIGMLAKEITREDIEWKWTNGDGERALQLLYYQIEYIENLFDPVWTIDQMSFYSLKLAKVDLLEKSLSYMDKIISKQPNHDLVLDLFREKGFILWALGKNGLTIDVFKLKKDEAYEKDGSGFMESVKLRFKYYKESGIVFPDQKTTWKTIKKIK